MEDYTYELKIEENKIERFRLVTGVITLFLRACTLLGSIYLFFEGIRPFIGSDAQFLVDIIKELKLGDTTVIIAAGVFGVVAAIERKGKKRAIKEKAYYQELAEKNEPNRTSSGLTEYGESPTEEEI